MLVKLVKIVQNIYVFLFVLVTLSYYYYYYYYHPMDHHYIKMYQFLSDIFVKLVMKIDCCLCRYLRDCDWKQRRDVENVVEQNCNNFVYFSFVVAMNSLFGDFLLLSNYCYHHHHQKNCSYLIYVFYIFLLEIQMLSVEIPSFFLY